MSIYNTKCVTLTTFIYIILLILLVLNYLRVALLRNVTCYCAVLLALYELRIFHSNLVK